MTPERPSEMGLAHSTPLMPQIKENRMTRGSRKNTCRLRDTMVPIPPSPMAGKNWAHRI